jgi:phenylpropionate dioxygenase-like ring-hydroxylating dioxygenase large terminal subunit
MRPETQREILRRFFALREAHTTTMAAEPYRQRSNVYTDPDRLDAEVETLFRGYPLVVGLSADLPATGDYVATEAAGVPLILVRSEDASVRCFLNACRHRGGRVATGRGRPGRAFKCPYHSWAYDLNGDLLGQPMARDAFEGLDRSELGLIPIPVAERFGLILAQLGGVERIDAASELGELGRELAEYHLEDYRFFDESSRVIDANWKLAHDTFLESYHVFSLHRDSLAPDMLSTPFVYDVFGAHGRGSVMRREVLRLLERDESEWELRPHASTIYLLFPCAIMNFPMSGHAELWDFYPENGSPHHTRVTVRFYVPRDPGSDKERGFWEANVRYTLKVVYEEDFAQQEDIHRSLRTGLLPEVVYGRNEPALIHHHQQVELALAAGRPPQHVPLRQAAATDPLIRTLTARTGNRTPAG